MGSQKKNIVFPVKTADTLLPFLMQQMNGKSRTAVKSLLAHRQVSVNGAVQTRHDTPLKSGDSVSVLPGKGNIELRHPKLRLVYEDEYLLVVEKKQGLLTVPARVGSQELTVFSILKAYVRKQNPRNNVYVVHRLDRETSGLLVFAKSIQLQEYMRSYWKDLVTQRTYIALAEGQFEKQQGTITTWLTEDKRNAVVYSSPVDDGGDKAVTHYKVLKDFPVTDNPSPVNPYVSLVELNLETGRTNQIRVHLASIGHPVVGDRKYGHGNDFSPADRLCLHARVLEFIHPATEQIVHFETPIPKDFRIK
ncbi:MAG: RluA family pseudouridine synthase [Paludibacteraceae bacterium]|nr:RluA family pseudouridine synthase [Paludibacteraceae bacterium]